MVAHWKQLSRNATGQQIQRFFKGQFKQGRSHQTIQQICSSRCTIPPLGLPTGDNNKERNVRDIVYWSLEFISM